MGLSLATPSSRLARFLHSLFKFIRSCRIWLSTGRIAPALRSWSAWLWRSLWTFTRPRSRLLANDAPGSMMGNDSTSGECANVGQAPEQTETHSSLPATDWEKILSALRQCTSNSQPTRKYELSPATPEGGSQRYNFNKSRRSKLEPPDNFTLPAGQKTLLLSPPSLPDDSGWRRHVHPEGVALFYHEEFHIFTERDVSDSTKEKELLACAAILVERAINLKTDGVTLDDLTHIVLNMDDDIETCHYYFVDHTNRLLFWVDRVTTKELRIDLQGIGGYNHIKYMVEAYYWTHCEYYPHDRVLPTAAFEDLRGMLNYAKIDIMTTDSSSSPFGHDELVAMMALVDSLKDVDKISDPYSIWAIARLTAYFTENQFLNFYGQACARLNADTAMFGEVKWNEHFMFKAINVFLLGSPSEHALRLQRVWVDGMIIQPRWKDFITRLTTELARYTIFSTVMLAVNFNLLSSPGVVLNPGLPAGPIEIIIFCSVVSTIASIVFSFGLLNIYSNPRLLIARNALDAMWTLSQSKTGMAWLAITHSLPIASLIWSIALFSVALAVHIFGRRELATVSTLSVEFLVIVMFLTMGVRVMQRFSKNDDVEDVVPEIFAPDAVEKHTEPPPGDIEQGSGTGR